MRKIVLFVAFSIFLAGFASAVFGPDFNSDGIVDGADLGILLGHWGVCEGKYCPWDLDEDWMVGDYDLQILLNSWGVYNSSNSSYLPDLTINDLSYSYNKWGGLSVLVSVKNIGNAVAGENYLQISLDNEVVEFYISEIAVGQTYTFQWTFYGVPKNSVLGVYIDYYGQVEESNEDNNFASLIIR